VKDDWKQLLDKVGEIAEAKGKPKTKMLKHFRRALRITDKATSGEYSAGYYKWKWRLDGRKQGIYRSFISKGAAFRYQWKKTRRFGWFYRSMIRRGADKGYHGNLSHLVEDGAINKQFKTYNTPKGYRRNAFKATRSQAQREAIRGIQEALKTV
tara:strand:+ start:160 stop:621 length:462 start_codon:yes stop_codon:yes gene_type:complete